MRAVITIAEAVMRDAIRRKVVWVVLVFAALLSFAIPGLPDYGVGVVAAVFREVSIALMYVAALTVGLSLAATRIPSEVDRRTVFTIVARPVSRWQYVLGTWLGILAVVGVVLVAFSGVAIGVGLAVYQQAMPRLFAAAFAVWLETGVITAAAVTLSTRFGAVTSIVGALTLAFAGHSLSTLGRSVEGVAPLAFVPSLEVFNVINAVAHGSGYGVVYAAAMLGVFVGWSGLLLLGASALFSRRDL